MPRRVHQSVVISTAALITLIGGLISLPADAGAGGGTLVGTILQDVGPIVNNQTIPSVVSNGNSLNIGAAAHQPNSPAAGSQGPMQLLGTPRVINGGSVLTGPHAAIATVGFPVTSLAGTAAAGGFAALVAPGARDAGTITATLGTLNLAGGSAFTLDFYGDRLITLTVNDQIASQAIDVATGKPLKSLIANDRRGGAGGDRVALSAAAARAVVNSVVNTKGVVEARSIGTRNGMIVLGAATAGKPAKVGVGGTGGPVGLGVPIGFNLGAASIATGALGGLGTSLGGAPLFVSGLIGDTLPVLTDAVAGTGLVNANLLTGLLAPTQTLTSDLLGTLTGPLSAIGDLGAGLLLAPPPAPALMQSQLTNPLMLASLGPSDVLNARALNQPPPRRGGADADGVPPRFGGRFFVPPPPGETRFIKYEAVLHVGAGVPSVQVELLTRRLSLRILSSQSLGLLGVTSYRVHIDNGGSVASVIRALAAYRIVAGAQANYTYQLADESVRDAGLAGATQEGDAAQYALSKLGVVGIHHELKGTNVTVAIVDSQIDVAHPDLDGVIADEFDAVGEAQEPHAHGTGMAGAIAAHRRLMGIAPAARLYAVHAFSSGAANPGSTSFNILKGVDWAAGKGVGVINMSFAGPRDPSLERVLKVAHDKGIVLIAAAGNAGPKSPPLYPGADPNVIAVTATDANDIVFKGANRGRYIAVAAPGVDILVPAPESAYQVITGTSVACAEVSGIAALLLERNPNLKPEDIRKILTSTATHLAGRDRDDDYGAGLVDPSKAIKTAGELTSLDMAGAQPQPEADPGGSR